MTRKDYELLDLHHRREFVKARKKEEREKERLLKSRGIETFGFFARFGFQTQKDEKHGRRKWRT